MSPKRPVMFTTLIYHGSDIALVAASIARASISVPIKETEMSNFDFFVLGAFTITILGVLAFAAGWTAAEIESRRSK